MTDGIWLGFVREKRGRVDQRIEIEDLLDGLERLIEDLGSWSAAREEIARRLRSLERAPNGTGGRI